MDFKVDYYRIFDIGDALEVENNEFKELLDNLIKNIEELGASWEGADYENFKENATTYIKNLENTYNELDYIAKFIKKSSNVYSDSDEAWAKNMKEITTEEDKRK